MQEPTTNTGKIPPVVKSLGAVSFLNDISSEMIYPVIPLFLTSILGASVAVVGFIEGTVEATASILKLLSGWLSDKMGRRKPLVVGGYGLSTFSRLILAAANGWPMVFVARFTDRFGKGIRTAARDAWIADVTPKEIRGRSFGFHRAFDTAGAVVGPLLAAFLLGIFHEQYRVIFLLAFVPGILAVLVLMMFAKEKRIAFVQQSNIDLPKTKLLWKDLPRTLWIFIGFSMVFSLGNSSDVFLLLRGRDLGWSALSVALAYALYNALYAFSSYPAGILSDRIPRGFIVSVGIFIFALTYFLFGFSTSTSVLWPIFALYGISVGLTEGTSRALLADLATKELYGSLYGLYGTIISVANLLASLWFGLVWQIAGTRTAFMISAGLAFIAAIGIFFIASMRREG